MDLRAEMLLERQRYEDAVAWCRHVLDRGGASRRVRLVLARALIALHQEDEAEKEIRAHLQQSPRDAEAYRMLGEMAFRNDRYPESTHLLKAALRLAPSDDSTRMLLDVVRNVRTDARRDHVPATDAATRCVSVRRLEEPVEESPLSGTEPAFSDESTIPNATAAASARLPAMLPPSASSASRSASVRAVMATLDLPHQVSSDWRPSVPMSATAERPRAFPDPAPQVQARHRVWTTGWVGVAVAAALLAWRFSPFAQTVATSTVAAASVGTTPVPKPIIERRASPPKPWPAPEPTRPPELGTDTWIHPLNGPVRRMPIHDGRVFGAERPGERPIECANGHCGVDLGESWGEPVMTVHDGVIDRVQRGPNPDHGGMYVRIAHRGGRVFTQYFHLAGIPRRIVPGVSVRTGEVIGIVGDTGVKQSGPHLHFTISVRPTRNGQERYFDPEPLIALWPLRIPAIGGLDGIVDTEAAPGLPHGASAGRR